MSAVPAEMLARKQPLLLPKYILTILCSFLQALADNFALLEPQMPYLPLTIAEPEKTPSPLEIVPVSKMTKMQSL